MPILFSVILVSLDNIQNHLENPFDQLGEDDVVINAEKLVASLDAERRPQQRGGIGTKQRRGSLDPLAEGLVQSTAIHDYQSDSSSRRSRVVNPTSSRPPPRETEVWTEVAPCQLRLPIPLVREGRVQCSQEGKTAPIRASKWGGNQELDPRLG